MGQHRPVPPLLPWGPGVAQTLDHLSPDKSWVQPPGEFHYSPGQVSGESVMTTAVEVGVCLLAQIHALVLCHHLEGSHADVILGHFLEELVHTLACLARRFKELSFDIPSGAEQQLLSA